MGPDHVPVLDAVYRLVGCQPEAVALEDADLTEWTWREVWDASLRLALALARELDLEEPSPAAGRAVAVLAARSARWLAATLAVLQVSRPFVWLCPLEVPNEAAGERSRNAEVLRRLQPCAIILDDRLPLEIVLPDGVGQFVADVRIRLLLSELLKPPANTDGCVSAPVSTLPPAHSRNPMCYVFTGGTTGSAKCAIIPHHLARHEISSYPDLFSASPADRLLQQSPCLWPAAPLGQLTIWLAFGCRLLFSAVGADLSEEVQKRHCSLLGVVPSVLATLQPDILCPPAGELRIVISWAESLDAQTAKLWSACPGVELFDLLLSTEVWLSLYSRRSPDTARAAYKPLNGAIRVLAIDDETGLESEPGAIGRLHFAGRFFFDGYLGHDAPDPFVRIGGERCFRSQDLVRQEASGLVFCGRADSLTKSGGKFVDAGDVEERLVQVLGVEAACLVTDPRLTPHHRVFIVPQSAPPTAATEVAKVVAAVRQVVQSGVLLHVLQDIPRKGATGKVDREALMRSAALLDKLPPCAQTQQQRYIALIVSCYRRRRRNLLGMLHHDPVRCACFAYLMFVFVFSGVRTKKGAGWKRLVEYLPSILLLSCRSLPRQRVLRITALAQGFGTGVRLEGSAFAAWPAMFWLGFPLHLSDEYWAPAGEIVLWWLTWKTSGWINVVGGDIIARGSDKKSTGNIPSVAPFADELRPDVCSIEPTAKPPDAAGSAGQLPYDGMLTRKNHAYVQLQMRAIETAGASQKSCNDGCPSAAEGVVTPVARELVGDPQLLRCLEDAGISVDPGGTFAGAMDSLRSMRLVSLLRDILGVAVPLSALLRCRSIPELTALVLSCERAAEHEDTAPPAKVRRVWFWYWSMRSAWLLRFDSTSRIEWRLLTKVLSELLTQQPALRMSKASSGALLSFANLASGALAVGVHAGAWPADTARMLSEACVAAWPTVEVLEDTRPWVREVRPAATWEALLNLTEWRENQFQPARTPAQFTLIPGSSTGEVQHDHLHILTTHAFADGFSIEPLVRDLCSLYSKYSESEGNSEFVPIVRDGPKEMERRLLSSLDDPMQGSLPLTYVCDYVGSKMRSWQIRARLPVEWARQATLVTELFQTTMEAVFLASLSVALARASGQSWVPLTLVVSARDGAGDSEHVSMVAEDRHLDLDLSSASLLETFLSVIQGTRLRLWRLPEPGAALPRVRTNVVRLVPPTKAAEAFRQIPYCHYREDFRRHCRCRQLGDLYAEELEDGRWEITAKFVKTWIGEAEEHLFSSSLSGAVGELLASPMARTM